MAYDIVFVEQDNLQVNKGQKEKAVGESIFLATLPTNPKVFAFFYPSDADTDAAEERLRALGQKTGDNLFVNIGTLADPDYEHAVERYNIKQLPVVVVTAVAPLAATTPGRYDVRAP